MNAEEPLPATGQGDGQVRLQRLLKLIVVVMGLVLIGGFAIIVATIVYRAGGGEDNPERTATTGDPMTVDPVVLPEGSEIIDMSEVDGYLALRVRDADLAEEILLIDIGTGEVWRRIPIE